MAMIFGTTHGLIVTAFNAVAHNLVVEPPALTFTAPTESEVYVFVCCALLVFVTPWLASHAANWRDRLGTISPNHDGVKAR
jgi:hypothetical protein